ncbi:MAG: SUMF1/EgtB/PvdO family nonheme iron enzyme, partial [Chthoniobacteraceae bacterium]
STVVGAVGGLDAGSVAVGATVAIGATDNNATNILVKRDAGGNFSAGTITAALNGTAAFATTAGSATSLSGSLAGDVTGTGGATVVASVGGVSAANVAAGANLANAATNLNTAGAIVKRDASGHFSAGTVTATSFSGSGAGLTNLNGANLSAGSVPYSKLLLTAGVTDLDISGAAAIAEAKLATIATAGKVFNSATTATTANIANAIVARDASGNFSAGTITATLNGNAATATSATEVSDGGITFAKLNSRLGAPLAYVNPSALEFVTVGNPGNLPDAGYGAVAASFQIGKYEVTNDQYAEFLTAVAVTDPKGLFHSDMETEVRGGIIREGYPGKFVYSVKRGMRLKPVAYVSWYNAIRFCNWLHNGKPTGAQTASTTEDGAYEITDIVPVSTTDWVVGPRKPGALFFLPAENQWYKAAYHKNDGATGNYWVFPTASDTLPTSTDASATLTNAANYFYHDGDSGNSINGGYATTGSTELDLLAIYLTDVGSFPASPSPYGTFDQGGNVFEWTETVNDSSSHIIRGGSWSSSYNVTNFPADDPNALQLRKNIRNFETNNLGTEDIGFRVAKPAIP